MSYFTTDPEEAGEANYVPACITGCEPEPNVQLKIKTGGLYKDSRGNVWKVVEKFPGGKARMVRQDRCVISEMYYRDIRASFTAA